MRATASLILLLLGCGSSPKPETAPLPPATAQPDPPAEAAPKAGAPTAEECDQLLDHTLDLIDKSTQFTEADKKQVREKRAKPGLKDSPEWKETRANCMEQMKQEDVRCALAAKSFEDMQGCGQGGPPPETPASTPTP
jgi:hypothetical protein